MAEIKYVGHIVKFPKTVSGLIKQGWWEIPEIMGASLHGLVGLCLGCISVYKYIQNNGANPEFKKTYVIMRPEDSRVTLLKNPVYTQFKG